MSRVSRVEVTEAGNVGAAPPSLGDSVEPRRGFRFGRRALMVDLTVWTLLPLLASANLVFRPIPGFGPSNPLPIVVGTFLEAYLWALLTPLIFWLVSRYSLDQGYRSARVLLMVAVGLVAALAVALPVGVLFAHTLPVWSGMESHARRVWGFTRGEYLAQLITFSAVVAAGVAWDYYHRYQRRREEAVLLQTHAAKLRADHAQLQAQLSEARLAALRAQLDPHFLFNTLNAASALMEKDPSSARRMISRLSELLRHSLRDFGEHEVPLDQELGLLRQYLEIMEIRYHGRLRTSIAVGEGVGNALVPNLILQPLAENAMKHGIGRARGHGWVEVQAWRSGHHLVLSVKDTGPSIRASCGINSVGEGDGRGIGLRNTRARLAELYGEDQGFELRLTPEGGTVAEIVLPYRTRAARAGGFASEFVETARHG